MYNDQPTKKEAYSGCFFARYLLLLILVEGNVLNHVFTVMAIDLVYQFNHIQMLLIFIDLLASSGHAH